MCMLGYTFMHGSKVFAAIGDKAPFSYKFINMVMACTGGGILVPIFINSIPVPLTQDAYPIAILISYALHHYFPMLREILALSPVFKVRTVVRNNVLDKAVNIYVLVVACVLLIFF
jgi:uncharacterized membrane protein YeiH